MYQVYKRSDICNWRYIIIFKNCCLAQSESYMNLETKLYYTKLKYEIQIALFFSELYSTRIIRELGCIKIKLKYLNKQLLLTVDMHNSRAPASARVQFQHFADL